MVVVPDIISFLFLKSGGTGVQDSVVNQLLAKVSISTTKLKSY